VGSFAGCLYEIDLSSGKVAASFRTQASAANISKVTRPNGSLDESLLFRSDNFEEMYRAGEILFEIGAILSSPTLSDGALLVGSCDRNLYCFR
jgi:outer membrane protein assembly factor BamB